MSKKFYRYLLKSNKTLNVFLIIINIIFASVYFFTDSKNNYLYSADSRVSSILISYILITIECIVLPIIELSFIHNRKRLDVYYSLPIKHDKIVTTTIFDVITKIIILHIVTILPILLVNIQSLNILMVLVYIVLTTIIVTLMVLFVSGLSFKTNSVFDACVVVGGYILIPIIAYFALIIFIDNHIFGYDLNLYNDFAKLILPILIANLGHTNINYMFGVFDLNILEWIIIILAGLFGLMLLRHELKYRKTERAEEISNNILTYPFVISTITLLMVMIVMFNTMPLMSKVLSIMFIYAAYAIMNFVYQRRIAFSKKSVVMFMATIMIAIGMVKLSDLTEGFGINNSYKNKTEVVKFSIYYNFYIYENGNNQSFTISQKDNSKVDGLIELVKENQERAVEMMEADKYDSKYDEDRFYMNLNVTYKDATYNYYGGNSIELNKDNIDILLKNIEDLEDKGIKFIYEVENYKDDISTHLELNDMNEFKTLLMKELEV